MAVAEYELYKRLKLLGEGSFGKAYLVECIRDNSNCVIKQMDLNRMSEDEKRATLKESKILEALKHPNIIRFREVYKTKKGKLCIVMDFADGGDLGSRIKQQNGVYFPEEKIIDWFTQICLAIKHVHDRKILHRDLKCQNIFLTKNDIVKLGDFGIAKVLNFTLQNAKTQVGTPYYLSPEILENQPYSFKSDIWSLGVVLYEMCALRHPFMADRLHYLAVKIVKGAYQPLPTIYSKELRNLVDWLLKVDASKRPTISQILGYPLIQHRIKKFLSESQRLNEFSHTILHKQIVIDVRRPNMDEVKRVNKEEPAPQIVSPAILNSNLPFSKKVPLEPQKPSIANEPPKVAERKDLKEIVNRPGPPMKVGLNPPPQINVGQDIFVRPTAVTPARVHPKEGFTPSHPKGKVVRVSDDKGLIVKNLKVNTPHLEKKTPQVSKAPVINPWLGGQQQPQPTPQRPNKDKPVKQNPINSPVKRKAPQKERPHTHQSGKKEEPPRAPERKVTLPIERIPIPPERRTVDPQNSSPKKPSARPQSQRPSVRASRESNPIGTPIPYGVKKAGSEAFPQLTRPDSHQLAKRAVTQANSKGNQAKKLILPMLTENNKDGKKEVIFPNQVPRRNQRERKTPMVRDLVEMMREMEGIIGGKFKVATQYDEDVTTLGDQSNMIAQKDNDKDEDREDELDDKENCQGSNGSDRHRKEEAEMFEYMVGDHYKLLALKTKLCLRLGTDAFHRVYNVLKEEVTKSMDYDAIEKLFNTENLYDKILKENDFGTTRDDIEQNLHLMFTLITLEDRKNSKGK